ncbi:hypothetical protein Y032_0002g1055 [Ancylostoma ceylanicum]|nr:hypothetical protein Y032_0002g1055 [Ancylostoma ceylanicum]
MAAAVHFHIALAVKQFYGFPSASPIFSQHAHICTCDIRIIYDLCLPRSFQGEEFFRGLVQDASLRLPEGGDAGGCDACAPAAKGGSARECGRDLLDRWIFENVTAL